MKIYVVGGSKNKFLPLDDIREKFFVDVEHKEENIDLLNPFYCELTGLYHLWKNCKDDIVGLEHYRRYFVNDAGEKLSKDEIESILKDYDIIMYKWPGESATQAMYSTGKGPELNLAAFLVGKLSDEEMKKFFIEKLTTQGVYEGNMFICKKELIDEYCEWLFNLLWFFDRLDARRVPRIDGYVAEYLFGPWMQYYNKKIYNCKRQAYSRDLTKKLTGHV